MRLVGRRFLGGQSLLRMGSQGSAGGGGTAYVTGDQSGVITITQSVDTITDGSESNINNIVDGAISNGTVNALVFKNQQTAGLAAGRWLKFDFGTAKVVDEAKWYVDDASQHHTGFQWQGSNDDSNWTNIGAEFNFSGVTYTMTTLNGNTTAYRYYRLFGGLNAGTSGNPWNREIEFKRN